METNRILKLSAYAGRIILENGGETYRVEETICRICAAFEIKEADSFVTPTGMMISVTDDSGHTATLIKRINSRTVNLEKISKVNDLSRLIMTKTLTLDFAENELEKIDSTNHYSKNIQILAAASAAGFFTLLFGGTLKDFFVAFIIGSLIKILSIKLNKIQINQFFINIIGGALAALSALICVSFNFADQSDKIIIGSIMLLVPGLAITNAIRDTLEGDLVSGVSRAIEALFIAGAIAVGTGVILKLWLLNFGGVN
ncbi:MAG: threonine/serine exporter family protein [Clostridiaceae bacterium]|nr:threonine/serine exporter family protein [Clostridiaceae bacterium]